MHPISFQLACNAPPCFPEPKFSWVIADKLGDNNPTEVIESKRLTIDLKGNLHFGNVIQNDQMGTKIYMCKMYNPNLRTTKEGSESKIEVIFGKYWQSLLYLASNEGIQTGTYIFVSPGVSLNMLFADLQFHQNY